MPYERGVRHVVDLKSHRFCIVWYQQNGTKWIDITHDVVPLLLLSGFAKFLTLTTTAHDGVKKACVGQRLRSSRKRGNFDQCYSHQDL